MSNFRVNEITVDSMTMQQYMLLYFLDPDVGHNQRRNLKAHPKAGYLNKIPILEKLWFA